MKLFFLILTLLVLVGCSSESNTMSDPVPPTQPPVQTPAKLEWSESHYFAVKNTVKRCIVTYTIKNTGTQNSTDVLVPRWKQHYSDALGQVPWSSEYVGLWVPQYESTVSLLGGEEQSFTIEVNPNDVGEYRLSVRVDGLGYLTKDRDEGGGMFSSTFPVPVSN